MLPTGKLVPLFFDDSLIAFDKPSGLLTVPGRDLTQPSLWRLAEGALGGRLWAVHRLDRETSGLVIFARSASAHRTLNDAFAERNVHKIYFARVSPTPAQARGTLAHLLVPARRGFMRLAKKGEGGVLAETSFRVLANSGAEGLVELSPHTGRTHQLRLQLATAGSPIVGEPHYRTLSEPTRTAPVVGQRLWLHATSLQLTHPLLGTSLHLRSPNPPGLWPHAPVPLHLEG